MKAIALISLLLVAFASVQPAATNPPAVSLQPPASTSSPETAAPAPSVTTEEPGVLSQLAESEAKRLDLQGRYDDLLAENQRLAAELKASRQQVVAVAPPRAQAIPQRPTFTHYANAASCAGGNCGPSRPRLFGRRF